MAEIEELKKMLTSFRVSELQLLASFASWPMYSRKTDLLQCAIDQIERGSPRIGLRDKIREIYWQTHNLYASEPPQVRNGTRNRQPVPPDTNGIIYNDDRTRRYPSNKAPPLQLLTNLPEGLVPPVKGAVDLSKRPLESLGGANSSIPIHPAVKFKPLPFYDIIGELLKPTTLAPKGPSPYQETYFVFHLSPQQAQEIAMSRDVRPTAKCEYTVQVQLRFCVFDTICEQDDNFPPSICVRVNGKVAQLPNPIPTAKPGVEPKRPGRPVDITALCRISPTMPNHVEISWAADYARGYVVSISLVKRLTSDILLQRLKQFGNRLADHSRAMIKEKMKHDADSEIATTGLRVSLICPLGKMRMQLPSRAGTCTHLQCFDATTFLMMNEKKATWLCPVCDKPAPFHKLIIDGLFVEILRTVHDIDEIQFVADGSWSPIKRNSKDTQAINNTPAALKCSPVAPEKTVDLSRDASKHESTSIPAKKSKMEVIDLTETDSEDEGEACRSQSGHAFSSGSSSPSLNAQHSAASPSAARSSWKSNVLPPLPPLLNFKTSSNNNNSSHTSSSSPHSRSVLNVSSPVGLNLTLNSLTNPYKTLPAQLTSSHSQAFNSVGQPVSSSMPSWLDALNGHSHHNLKRPLPAHSTHQLPAKRMLVDNSSDSQSSSNSNISPLVDLDQLCSILDSDRDKEIASGLQFPTDFPMAAAANSSATNSCRDNSSQNIFNISPSDIISLD